MTLTFLAVIFLESSSVFAQEQPHQRPYEPDHLIPERALAEAHDQSYDVALRENLRLDATFFARMVILPSFDGESCLRLHGPEGESDITKASRFFLTSYQADQSIWKTLPQQSDEYRKPGPVIVSVATAPLPAAFARRLRAIWDEMLARSCPPDSPNMTLDGVSYKFSTPKQTAVATNPRQRMSPVLLTELGRSLMQYCEAKPEDRTRRMKSAEQHATVLENYLKIHPAK